VTRRRVVLTGALLGAAVAGSVATIAIGGGSSTSASTVPPPVTTATVVRTDLVTTTLTEGTLGYAPTDPVVNRLSGTYTALPASGATIHGGEALYRVDNLPVVLMTGTTPAFRSFAAGMTDGPDVTELQANLILLGDAAGLFTTATDHFSAVTADAVKQWQSANGYPTDGQLALGQVVFLPGPVLIGAESVAPGEAASPGDTPYQVTTTTRVVTVPLSPNLPSVSVGEAVSIVLPTNATTAGKITAIGPAPPISGSGSQGSSNGGGSSGGPGQSQASVLLTVTPDQPGTTGIGSAVAVQVSLTTQSATGVLAVPISALLALAGGGYGVEVVGLSAVHHLVGVTTGAFTGSQVQITGPGIEVGTKVVVAQ
jgi:peptidoglycan hydrolase-like protein with peptidoglycan-binding domain